MQSKFQTFKDGSCTIHLMDEDGNAATVKEKLRFEKRTIGYKRYIEAMTAKMQIDRLIRVFSPPSMDLSLHLARQRRVSDGTVSA